MPTSECHQCGVECMGETGPLRRLRPCSSEGVDDFPEGVLPAARSRTTSTTGPSRQAGGGEAQATIYREIERERTPPGGLRGVPGVPSLPGHERSELLVQPPEQGMSDETVLRKLDVGQRRHIIGSMKKAERSWTDLLALFDQELESPSGRTTENKEVLSADVIAEVYNPRRFTSKAVKHGLKPGCAFDIALGHDLLKPAAQQSVLTYLRHERPGLVIVSPPCGPFSQLNGLLSLFRNRNFKALQRYQDKLREGIKLLKFAVKVCTLCHELGLVFVLEQPWGASSWKHASLRGLGRLPKVWLSKADQCEFDLRDALGDLLKKSPGFLTNHEGIARESGAVVNMTMATSSARSTARASQRMHRSIPPDL